MKEAIASAVAATAASAAALWLYVRSTSELQTDSETRLRIKRIQSALIELEDSLADPRQDGDATQWQSSLQTAIPAIVTIRIMAVRHFDGERPSYSVATGFIVDKIRGLILTNRHVVTPGPVVADAIFVNNEEVDLIPIYRDPVHDFGFFRFDPKLVQFLTLEEIPLAPHAARIGTEIRVVGNDNGEKVQILPGVLAKLDRDAPQYGLSGYNDFNTFYYAAASSTSGGSSGSPVLNVQGAAIALNAGGATNAASSYYLPLDRVQRALKLLQSGAKTISRGTLQTIFRHVPFDEARKLGLDRATELEIRAHFPTVHGVLVVDQVLPEGPADTFLQVGDILLKLEDKFMTTFLALEQVLDDSVGATLALNLRRGGKVFTVNLVVQDLHSITPNRFLEVGQCLLHDLSYQQARNMALPVGGVYLASAGHMLYKADIYDPCIITSLDDIPTTSLDDFIEIVQRLPHGHRTSIQYFFPHNRHVIESAVISIDRQWFPIQLYTRNDSDGIWHPHIFELPTKSLTIDHTSTPATALQTDADWSTHLLSSIVFARFDTPLTIDGITMSCYDGVGYVIDGTKGLVLVDQYTVPVAMGECMLTIAASMQIPATIQYVHPIHNYTIVQYDPNHSGLPILPSIQLADSHTCHIGEKLRFVGLTRSWAVLTMESVVTKIERLATVDFKVPRYKPSNVELLSFDLMSSSARGGLFVNESNDVVAFYLAFVSEDSNEGQSQAYAYGFPIELVRETIQSFRNGRDTSYIQWLPVEFVTMSLPDARAGFGLSAQWLHAFEQRYDDSRQVLVVLRGMAGTQASIQLESGDIILSIDDEIVAKDDDVARVCHGKSSMSIVVLRNKKQVQVHVETCSLSTFGTDRVILWCGLLIQTSHVAVLQRGYLPKEGGVYCSQWFNGSPAEKFTFHAMRFIVQVNDVATPTIDDFLNVVLKLKHGDSVRLKTYDLDTRQDMAILKTDYQYWPTMEIKYSKANQSWGVNTYKQ